MKKILGPLVAMGLSTALVLGLLEIVLHLVGYPRTKTGHQRFFVEYDADRGWRSVPGAEGDFSTDEYDVHLQYNSRGIRGPERAYEKPAGVRRVVVLGDSLRTGSQLYPRLDPRTRTRRILCRRPIGPLEG